MFLYGVANGLNINSAITGTGPLFLNTGGTANAVNTYTFNTAATYTGATTPLHHPKHRRVGRHHQARGRQWPAHHNDPDAGGLFQHHVR